MQAHWSTGAHGRQRRGWRRAVAGGWQFFLPGLTTENLTGFSNFVKVIAILLIPAAQVFMFGWMVRARRHAWMVYTAMLVMAVIGIGVAVTAEQPASQVLRSSGGEHRRDRQPERREHGRQGGQARDR